MKNTVRFFAAAGLFGILVCSGCSFFKGLKSGDELSVGDLAFYRDQVDIATFIQDEDSPKRQASLRLIAQAMQNPGRDILGDLENALRIDSFNPFAYYYYAFALLKEQQFQKAELMSRRAVELFAPDDIWQAKAYVLQARSRAGLSQKAKATELYQRAKELDPRNPLVAEGMKGLETPAL